MFWAKLRLLFVAVYWFNPLVYAAAVLSKEDCEMACDERTIALLKTKKASYGKILLDAVNVGTLRERDDVFCVATTMISSRSGLRTRIESLAAGEYNKYVQFFVGIAFVLCCTILCFPGKMNLHGMSGEETIRQYVYYSNADYQKGMRQLSVYDEWDYFFYNKLDGEILEVQKINSGESIGDNVNYKNETYLVRMKENDNGITQQEKKTISLVKQKENDDWKIDWRVE